MGKIMGKGTSRCLIGWILVVVWAGSILSGALEPADTIPAQQRNSVTCGGCTDRDHGQPFARTELFFGKDKPNGSTVTAFLEDIITPRFPNGLTVLSGTGQFRDSSGMIKREGAVFVILLYPLGDKDSGLRIEEIRDGYRKAFAQKSVLRVDDDSCVYF